MRLRLEELLLLLRLLLQVLLVLMRLLQLPLFVGLLHWLTILQRYAGLALRGRWISLEGWVCPKSVVCSRASKSLALAARGRSRKSI